MTEMTWHTKGSGDALEITVEWFNENDCRMTDKLRIEVTDRADPRSLEVRINEVRVARLNRQAGSLYGTGIVYPAEKSIDPT